MRYLSTLLVLVVAASLLAACTPAPPVTDSREVLWRQFGGHPVDDVIMGWGAPTKESHLTDGSRLLTYRRSTIYDSQTPYEQESVCEVSFMAKAPKFMVADIAMQGSPNDCRLLAQGRIGDVRVPAAEPAYPYGSFGATPYPYPYRRYPF